MIKSSRKVLCLVAVLGASSMSLCQIETQAAPEALDRFAREQAIRMTAERQEALRMAPLLGLPVRDVRRDGSEIQLVSIADGVPKYLITSNVNAARTTRTNVVQPGGSMGLNLTGTGVTLGIWDGGNVRTTHTEFNGRATIGDPGTGEASNSDHGTHVGGTMIARGANAAAKGMATAALLRSFGWTSDLAEMAAAAQAGMLVSNHSYGFITGWTPGPGIWRWYGNVAVSQNEDLGFGLYDATAQAWDQLVHTALFYLPVKAAGNDRGEGPASQPVTHEFWNGSSWQTSNVIRSLDGTPNGYDSVSYNATAKNILTVGAVNDIANYTGPASVVMTSFSGWGPTDDGRIKPDIVGNGVNLFSSIGSGNSDYGGSTGTSMATPNVSGSLALLIQQYKPTHGGNNMLASTLKGVVIHTADEAGAAAGPDYRFGWGLMNTGAAVRLIRDDQSFPFLINEWAIQPGEQIIYWARSPGTGPLKATLVWTDPAGPMSANTLDPAALRLVNDLDMRVKFNSTTFSPWVLNPASPGTAATKGDNFRDNVEQISISSPSAGWYRLAMTHKGVLAGNNPQIFSLITSGIDKVLSPLRVTVQPNTVIGSLNATGRVTLNDVAPPGGFVVKLTSDSTKVVVPSSVTVPAGSDFVTFKVGTLPVSNTQIRRITANAFGLIRSTKMTLEPGGLLTFSVSPAKLKGGGNVTAKVGLSGPAVAGGQKILTADNSSAMAMPSSITVPATLTTAQKVVATSVVATNRLVTCTARMGGVTLTDTVTLTP